MNLCCLHAALLVPSLPCAGLNCDIATNNLMFLGTLQMHLAFWRQMAVSALSCHCTIIVVYGEIWLLSSLIGFKEVLVMSLSHPYVACMLSDNLQTPILMFKIIRHLTLNMPYPLSWALALVSAGVARPIPQSLNWLDHAKSTHRSLRGPACWYSPLRLVSTVTPYEWASHVVETQQLGQTQVSLTPKLSPPLHQPIGAQWMGVEAYQPTHQDLNCLQTATGFFDLSQVLRPAQVPSPDSGCVSARHVTEQHHMCHLINCQVDSTCWAFACPCHINEITLHCSVCWPYSA